MRLQMPSFSLRTKLIASFSLVIVVGVFLSTIIGIRLIGSTIINQAQDKVRLDLNSAREVYLEESGSIKTTVRLTANQPFIKDALSKHTLTKLRKALQTIKSDESLDILTMTDAKGKILLRVNNPAIYGDQPKDEIVHWVLLKKQAIVATQIIAQRELEKEGKDLAKRAQIVLIPTPMAKPRAESIEISGMMIKAAAPIFDDERKLIGVLYGGRLLNRNYQIVDKVKDIVYKAETYKGKDIGTATIFQGDLRISTNVLRSDGERAIGTRVSREVYDQVIGAGKPWIGRAFVVKGWYITAYEPIQNVTGKIVGMLYVGMLEAPYVDLRNRVVFIFLGIAFLGVILLSIIANITTHQIVKPIKDLVLATKKIAQGDLSHHVAIRAGDEIGDLAESFNKMVVELQKATEGYVMCTRTLEKKVEEKTDELKLTQDQLIQSEKLSSLGKLAAGIAHEINNPLTAILIHSHLIKEKLSEIQPTELQKLGIKPEFRENLQLIIDETTRCGAIVKGLLEFARLTPPEKIPTNINKVLDSMLLLFESQALLHNVNIEENLQQNLPPIMLDVNKIKQVFTNVILNAIEAMSDGGTLLISSQVAGDGNWVDIKFKDTGCGIEKEDLLKIFDPFFTTKGTKGTGLGLSISYGIIQQHKGSIQVQSEVNKGTLITITLPINE